MRHQGPRPGQPPTRGHCEICGDPLIEGRAYWITRHPDGVHHACRAWDREPFPFDNDLDRLRLIARAAMRAWREVVRDGRWLASARRGWPSHARQLAHEWLQRRRRLAHQLDRLRDRLRL